MKRIIAAFTIGLVAGVLLSSFIRHDPVKPQIISETRTEFRYLHEQPTDYTGLLAAWNSPLDITGAMSGAWLNVTATDGYKEARKGFEIAIPEPHNMITGGLYTRLDRAGIHPGAWCMYNRMIFPRAGIGAGCMVDGSSVGIMAGAAWTW